MFEKQLQVLISDTNLFRDFRERFSKKVSIMINP